MSDRRMFSSRVINSAKFLKMPLSTQALYFHLGMRADDDGVVEAFSVMRSTGANEDDLRILVSKGFVIILNEDLVCYIADWNENNLIRPDRKKDSIYQELLIKVVPDVELVEMRKRASKKKEEKEAEIDTSDDGETAISESSEYPQIFDGRPMDNQWTTNGPAMARLSKDKLIKESIPLINKSDTKEKPQNECQNADFPVETAENTEKNKAIDYNEVFNAYHSTCKALPQVKVYSQERKAAIKSRIVEFGKEKLFEVFKLVNDSDFLSGRSENSFKGTSFDWILKRGNFIKVLEGNYDNSRFARASPANKQRTGHDGFKTDYGKDKFEEISL